MNIVMISPEMRPFAETGGLADVTDSLSRALRSKDTDVTCLVPAYQDIFENGFPLESVDKFSVPLAGNTLRVQIWRLKSRNKQTVYFIGINELFSRPGVYGHRDILYGDNHLRYAFFCFAVLSFLKRADIAPDILHCHDWQTGLLPVYRDQYFSGDPFFKSTRTVFTIHNLGFQGVFPKIFMPVLGVDWRYFHAEGLEYYDDVSFLKAGIVYSDAVTTVSPTYAKEVQTKELGYGLDGLLRKHQYKLSGILNGIDPAQWDPKKDPALAAPFDKTHPEGKGRARDFLQRKYGLTVQTGKPLIGMITRLASQKGLDILSPVWENILSVGAQVVILGTGDKKYEDELRGLARRRPRQFAADISFNRQRSRQIYAGSDLFLMPSLYEPCGLSQMICLRYGTLPIVRKTGGLADSITDLTSRPREGCGFVFEKNTSAALLETVQRAIQTYYHSSDWTQTVRRVMGMDFSWRRSAKAYKNVYLKCRKGA